MLVLETFIQGRWDSEDTFWVMCIKVTLETEVQKESWTIYKVRWQGSEAGKENTLKSERESSRSNRAEPVGPVGGVLKGLLDTNCKRKLEELELFADVGYLKKSSKKRSLKHSLVWSLWCHCRIRKISFKDKKDWSKRIASWLEKMPMRRADKEINTFMI